MAFKKYYGKRLMTPRRLEARARWRHVRAAVMNSWSPRAFSRQGRRARYAKLAFYLKKRRRYRTKIWSGLPRRPYRK